MNTDTISPAMQRRAIWAAPVMVVIFAVGFLVLGGFVPPPSPKDSAEEIARTYSDDGTQIRWGCLLMAGSLALLVPWGSVIIAQLRRVEGTRPWITYGMIACLAACFVIVQLFPMTWAVASFRPEDTSVDFTRGLNDIGWFIFLYTWPPFATWYVLIGIAVLGDRAADPVYPRWIGYLNIWCALLVVPGGLIAFFKDGPFAFDGVFAFYIPVGVFFVWIVAMTYNMIRAVGASHSRSAPSQEPSTGERTTGERS